MIYLFNKTATPWVYAKTNEYYARLTSNRTNSRTNKEDYIGIALSSNIPVVSNLNDYVNMVNECVPLSDSDTTVDFRHKDLNPWINKLSKPGVQYNVDVFLVSIPLDGGIVTNITGANVLGYRAVNNEFFVYFYARRNQNTYETPIFTITNASTMTEIDYVFSKTEDGNGYQVIENRYNSNPATEIKHMKIRKYRPKRATKLIFVRDTDFKFFDYNYGQKLNSHIVVQINDDNIDSIIDDYVNNQGYKAATFFSNANRGVEIVPSEGDYVDKILKNFHHVNAILHSGYCTIIR